MKAYYYYSCPAYNDSVQRCRRGTLYNRSDKHVMDAELKTAIQEAASTHLSMKLQECLSSALDG